VCRDLGARWEHLYGGCELKFAFWVGARIYVCVRALQSSFFEHDHEQYPNSRHTPDATSTHKASRLESTTARNTNGVHQHAPIDGTAHPELRPTSSCQGNRRIRKDHLLHRVTAGVASPYCAAMQHPSSFLPPPSAVRSTRPRYW
jgi:hypothetical protein